MKINFKKSKYEIMKETIKLKNEYMTMRAKLVRIGDIVRSYEETHKNSAKYLRQIANIIRYNEEDNNEE